MVVSPGAAVAAETPPSTRRETPAGPVTFTFGGQLRLRYENDEGFTIKGYEPGGGDELLLTRVRLDLAAALRDGPRFVLQLQDAHAFLTRFDDADFPASSPIEDTLDIRQAHVEWLLIGGSPFGLKVGRQQIAYGDQRVFGPGNWGNTGRFAWDAAMLKLETKSFASDLWVGAPLTYRSDVWPNRPVEDFRTLVSYTEVKRLPFRLDLFYVLKSDDSGGIPGESGAGDLRSHTVGFQAEGKVVGALEAAATFAAQRGQHGGDSIRAWGANAKLGATAPHSWKPRLGVQYTVGSGDADPADGTHGTFDGVYGGRDIFFYGYLNLFFWANLRDAEIDLRFQPARTVTCYVELHRFALEEATDAWYTTGLKACRRDPSGRSGRALGDEIDARVVWNAGRGLELMAGIGHFRPGEFVKETGPSGPATWTFAQAVWSW